MSSVKLWRGDCLEKMKLIKSGSVDLILCDLPYGTTPLKWDSVIAPEPLWAEYERVLKPTGTAVLFCSQPFTARLVISNPKLFKYCLIWVKGRPANFAQASNMPLKTHEDIAVFSKGAAVHKGQSTRRMTYNPQGVQIIERPMQSKKVPSESSFTQRPSHSLKPYVQQLTNFPSMILRFAHDKGGLHPTQKPVKLLEYLIRTYSDKGQVVLDNCMGSGSTGIACVRTKRRFIGIERDPKYFEIALNRLKHVLKGGIDVTSKAKEKPEREKVATKTRSLF